MRGRKISYSSLLKGLIVKVSLELRGSSTKKFVSALISTCVYKRPASNSALVLRLSLSSLSFFMRLFSDFVLHLICRARVQRNDANYRRNLASPTAANVQTCHCRHKRWLTMKLALFILRAYINSIFMRHSNLAIDIQV